MQNALVRAISAALPINDSWPKLSSKILLTPEKETGVSRQTEGTERFRNIDPTKNGGLGLQLRRNHLAGESFLTGLGMMEDDGIVA